MSDYMKNLLVMVEADEEIRDEFVECFNDRCNISFCSGEVPENILKKADIIIGEPSEEQLEIAENLELLQLTWAGADKFLKMKHLPQNVTLATASGAFGKVISEYIVGGILALYRDFPAYFENQQNHIWQKQSSVDTISGKKVLILGTGDIGKNVAKKLKTFDVQAIIGIRYNAKEDFLENFDEIYGIIELDNLLPEADIVVCCLPETNATIGILNEEYLNLLKQNAVLVNVGRGSLIVNDALIKVLEKGTIKGAVLDVLETEPLEVNSKLWDFKNVIITPHIAGPSFSGDEATKDKIWKICFNNVERYLQGAELQNVVDRMKGY